MPQRFPIGNGLVVSTQREAQTTNTRTAIKKAAARVFSQAEVGCRPMVENLESRELLSSTWFVSPSGSNTNSGSISAPFKTIQQAANVAHSGDVVDIETGTYHETVTPHSGVTFQPYNGEKVTITGADAITGWTKVSGDIYSAPMGWDLGEGSNQVFVNGVAMNEAQFPNSAVGDVSTPNTTTMQSVRGSTIYDSSLNQPTNYWKGSIIHMDPGEAWVDETGTVTSSSPGSITIRYQNMGAHTTPVSGNKFQLFGTFKALDTAGEWYRDPSSGRLYLWAPNGADPSSLDVEAKHRQDAFNLNNANGVTISHLNIFSSTIATSHASPNVKINGITAVYVSHNMIVANGWYLPPTQGIILRGNNDVLENSTIAYSTGDGVVVAGQGAVVTNNTIHDVDTVGADIAGVRLLASNETVSHNTIYNTGRDGVIAEVAHATVTNNAISAVSLQTTEAGGIYTANTNGQGSVMAYNDITNVHSGGWGATAIFLDNNTAGWVIHNNVTSNVDWALKFNYSSVNNNIYNNTLAGNTGSVGGATVTKWSGTHLTNNILIGQVVGTGGAAMSGNTKGYASGVGAGSIPAGASGTPVVSTPTPSLPPSSTPPTSSTTTTPPTTTPLASSLIEGMSYTAQSGGMKFDNVNGLGYIYNNDWASYQLNFGTAGATKFTANIASLYAGGTIEIHLGSPTGTLIGKLSAAVTGSWSKYTAQSTSITKVTGVQKIYLVFKGPKAGVVNLESFKFA